MSILPPPVKRDVSELLMTCEYPGCGVTFKQKEGFSIVVSCAANGVAGAAFQCPSEQHWGHSFEHAASLAKLCIEEHIAANVSRETQEV